MLGKRLKELRGPRTQQEIADKLEISRARYSHYENDHVQPDNELLQRMANFHKVSIDYLLGRESEGKTKNGSIAAESSAEYNPSQGEYMEFIRLLEKEFNVDLSKEENRTKIIESLKIVSKIWELDNKSK
ncbi:helix-turn-helix domain-containing protein [Gorillibacterium sp. sgz5001074]|uniref:helix-turn-helix domain-containing protein n=1 Tax=Gorillibacterium sp. sgz5001074 TaxID=3446695 RepID=UPI003F6745F3